MAWKLPGVCLALAVGVASMGMANAKLEFMLDIGGPMDGPFIGTGWHGTEGPAPQWGRVWDSTCRWASQGATVTIPVSPGVVNHLEMRAAMGEGDGQELRLFLDGRKIASLRFEKSLIYRAEIPTDALNMEGWAELRLETEIPAPRSEGDSRDLRVAVDWIRVSADAPARDVLKEALAKLCGVEGKCSRNKAPTHWRMRYDPNNVGETYSIQRFDQLMYDDSAFDTVETSYTPKMRPGDACWYRAWVAVDDNLDGVRKGLRLPGDQVAKDGHRSVSVNGMEVKAGSQRGLAHATAARLDHGASLIVVKVMKGPFAEPGGDPIIERPRLTQRIESGKTRIFTGNLVLTPGSFANRLRVRLMNPNGKEVGSAGFVAQDLGNGKRGSDREVAWTRPSS